MRGVGVEGGTEGLGPGEAPVAAAAEAEAGTQAGLGSAGRGGAGGEGRRSFEPQSLCCALTPPRPHPSAVRPRAVRQAIGGVAAAAVGGGERRGEETKEVSEFEGEPRAVLPSCPRTRAPCPGPSTETIMSCRRLSVRAGATEGEAPLWAAVTRGNVGTRGSSGRAGLVDTNARSRGPGDRSARG